MKKWVCWILIPLAAVAGIWWGVAVCNETGDGFPPNASEPRLDRLLGLRIGQWMTDVRVSPSFVMEKASKENESYIAIGVEAVPEWKMDREYDFGFVILRPCLLYVDKATRMLIGGLFRTGKYSNKEDLYNVLVRLMDFFKQELGTSVVNVRQKDNRLALDCVDPFGRERVLTITSVGDNDAHWLEVRVFDALSILAASNMNRISAPEQDSEFLLH